MAVVAGQRATIVAGLADPDWYIQRSAVTAWLRSGAANAGQLVEFMVDAPAQTRRHVYRLLRRLPEVGVADGLIDAIRERFGDGEAARLLPVCSSATVVRLLPELGHAAGDWSPLDARHPDVVLAHQTRPGDLIHSGLAPPRSMMSPTLICPPRSRPSPTYDPRRRRHRPARRLSTHPYRHLLTPGGKVGRMTSSTGGLRQLGGPFRNAGSVICRAACTVFGVCNWTPGRKTRKYPGGASLD